jgi:predicted PurR-regulated permease PerM
VALLIIAGLFTSIVPPIVSQTRQLVAHVPEISAKVEKRVSQLIDNPPPWVQKILKEEPAPAPAPAPVPADGASSSTNAPAGGGIDRETLHSASGWVANVLPRVGTVFGVVGRHVVGWFGILAGLALVPVYAFYLLVEKRGIESKWADYLPMGDSHFKSEVVFVVHQINNYLIAFFRGQVLVAICDGVLYTIGFLIVGVPYAVLLGAMSIALTMIPFLGAIVTCVAALVLSLAYHGDWLHPLLVLAVFGVVQTLEGLVISPKIMGNRVGLHPLTIIIAVMAGTTLLGGLLGGILAIPLTAVLRVLMARYVWTKRESSAS